MFLSHFISFFKTEKQQVKNMFFNRGGKNVFVAFHIIFKTEKQQKTQIWKNISFKYFLNSFVCKFPKYHFSKDKVYSTLHVDFLATPLHRKAAIYKALQPRKHLLMSR